MAFARLSGSLSVFAKHYGLLFQITDDILDVTGDSKQLGKSVGKDAAEGKVTFVTCFGLERARERAISEASAAEDALSPFGERAAFLHALIQRTVTRVK